MTSIQGYAKMLIMGIGGELGETQAQFVQVINSNVDRMARLVNNLLEISRLEAGRTELDGQVGFMCGTLIKRLCTIAWCLTGVAAIAFLAGTDIHPDQVFGQVAREILPTILPGMLGLFIAGLLASLPVLRRPVQAKAPTRLVAGRWLALWGVALVAIVTVLAWPAATRPLAAEDDLRPATYNIHYGYDSDWHLSLEAQAQAIEASGADVVALQEVDTGRPTSYMVDNALWLSRRLGMEVVYLPCVEHLSGIALLSRYPVLASEGILLPSELEQTGIIWAELDLGDRPVNAFAIWMGLEPDERARQLDAALPFVDAHPGPAVWGGDFNSTPESPVYARIAGAGFVDPFPTLGLGSQPTSPAISPLKRIDFVWLRGLEPVDAQVPGSTASDHRMVIVEASLP